MAYMDNSTANVAVNKEEVKAMVVQDLLIVLKMKTGADIVYEEASDETELNQLKVRTWNQLNE